MIDSKQTDRDRNGSVPELRPYLVWGRSGKLGKDLASCQTGAPRAGGEEGETGVEWGQQGQAGAHEDEDCVGS